MPRKKKEDRYRFRVGVTVDAKDDTPEYRYEEGDEAKASELPPHIDLKGLIRGGQVEKVGE